MPADQRRGPFWDFVAGRVDPPPIAALLGFDLVAGRARVVQRGRSVAFLAGELTQGDVVVATATATALIRG